MNEPAAVSVVLVGVGGYGHTYVNALLDQPQPARAAVIGVVDPYAGGCRRLPELQQRGIPVYADLEAFYARHQADLAVISSPIHRHCEQACGALRHGSHVLCEKPVAATIQDARAMAAAATQAGRFAAVGYQWSFSAAVQALKADIMAGRLGGPQRLRTLVLWPRNQDYYRRNTWAGALRTEAQEWVLDSPANNAAAHYLHNLFYLLGREAGASAMPVSLSAELYRANPITNYDTGVVRAWTDGGVEVLFYATHACAQLRGPEFLLEFEQATVRYDAVSKRITAVWRDGRAHDYGSPDTETTRKLWDCVGAVSGTRPIACDVVAATAQTRCINGMQESAPIRDFPRECVAPQGEGGARVLTVRDLDAVLVRAYEEARLPAEMGVPWAVPGREVDLRSYVRFPRR